MKAKAGFRATCQTVFKQQSKKRVRLHSELSAGRDCRPPICIKWNHVQLDFLNHPSSKCTPSRKIKILDVVTLERRKTLRMPLIGYAHLDVGVY